MRNIAMNVRQGLIMNYWPKLTKLIENIITATEANADAVKRMIDAAGMDIAWHRIAPANEGDEILSQTTSQDLPDGVLDATLSNFGLDLSVDMTYS